MKGSTKNSGSTPSTSKCQPITPSTSKRQNNASTSTSSDREKNKPLDLSTSTITPSRICSDWYDFKKEMGLQNYTSTLHDNHTPTQTEQLENLEDIELPDIELPDILNPSVDMMEAMRDVLKKIVRTIQDSSPGCKRS